MFWIYKIVCYFGETGLKLFITKWIPNLVQSVWVDPVRCWNVNPNGENQQWMNRRVSVVVWVLTFWILLNWQFKSMHISFYTWGTKFDWASHPGVREYRTCWGPGSQWPHPQLTTADWSHLCHTSITLCLSQSVKGTISHPAIVSRGNPFNNDITSWAPNGCNIFCFPRVIPLWSNRFWKLCATCHMCRFIPILWPMSWFVITFEQMKNND